MRRNKTSSHDFQNAIGHGTGGGINNGGVPNNVGGAVGGGNGVGGNGVGGGGITPTPTSPTTMQMQPTNGNTGGMKDYSTQAGPGPSVGSSVAATVLNSMAGNQTNVQMGLAVGNTLLGNANQILDDPSSRVNRFFNFGGLKYYFNVNNSYVRNKLIRIVFPYRERVWSRLPDPAGDHDKSGGWCPPRNDVNAPDLYIPVMAFVTYVLLISVVLGSKGTFHPALLGSTFTAGMIAMGLEIALYKLVFFLMGVEASIPLMDLLAYSAYKYVGIVCNISMGILFGIVPYYITLLTTTTSVGVFLVKTLQGVLNQGKASRTRSYVLFGMCLLQFPLTWFMGVASSLL